MKLDLGTLKTVPRGLAIVGAVLVADLGAYAFGVMSMDEQRDEYEAAGKSADTQTRAARNESREIEKSIGEIKSIQATYDEALKNGLLAPQDRLAAAQKLNELGTRNQLDFTYRFVPQQELSLTAALGGKPDLAAAATPAAAAQKAEEPVRVVNSKVEVLATAMLDGDLFRMIVALPGTFTGLSRLTLVNIERREDVTAELLARMSTGERKPLLAAKVEVDWMTFKTKPQEAGKPKP
ncbi:MAG: hypothetical protein K2Q10_00330 [Rhodospirillales bacterium]|nr:hypothetical protein [Rhodospirillales bacterium]